MLSSPLPASKWEQRRGEPGGVVQKLSLLWADEEEQGKVGAQDCPFPARAGPRRCQPPLSRQPRLAGSRKQEEGGRPVRRNNGAGQSHH